MTDDAGLAGHRLVNVRCESSSGRLEMRAECSACEDSWFRAFGDIYRWSSDADDAEITYARFWTDPGDEECAAEAMHALRGVFGSIHTTGANRVDADLTAVAEAPGFA